MHKFKRYGFQLNDPGKDPDQKFVRHGVGVPVRFTETPSRKRLKKILSFLGMICFSCMLAVIPVAVCDALGWVNETIMGVLGCILVVVIFISHLGFFFEMVVDASGRNWFAKSATMLWVYLFGACLLGTGWHLIKLVFGIDGN